MLKLEADIELEPGRELRTGWRGILDFGEVWSEADADVAWNREVPVGEPLVYGCEVRRIVDADQGLRVHLLVWALDAPRPVMTPGATFTIGERAARPGEARVSDLSRAHTGCLTTRDPGALIMRKQVELLRVVGQTVLRQAEAALPEVGALVSEKAVERVVEHRRFLQSASAHIMGCTAYEAISNSMTTTATDHPFADIMTAGRKVVFSRTLKTAEWANTASPQETRQKRSTISGEAAAATSWSGAESPSGGRLCGST